MKTLKRSVLHALLRKLRKLGLQAPAAWGAIHGKCCCSSWTRLGHEDDDEEEVAVPEDVPKGHMAVYVGEQHRRFVIRVAFLEHPLFRALLDQAREEYEYSFDDRLCIPCDETAFYSVLCYVSSVYKKRIFWSVL